MDQRKTIYVDNKPEEYVFQDFDTLDKELEKKYKGKCFLLDYVSEALITPKNIGQFQKFTLFEISQIKLLQQQVQNLKEELKQLTDDQLIQKAISEKTYTNAGKTILGKQDEQEGLKEKIRMLEQENKKLQSLGNQLKAKEQKIQDLSTQSLQFSNQISNLQSQNSKLSYENSQLIASKSEQQGKNLQCSDFQCQENELRTQLDLALQELKTSKLQINQYQEESKYFQTEFKKSKEKIDHLTIELLQLKKQINDQKQSPDDQNKVSQKLQQTVYDLENFYHDEDKQMQEKNQIKFLDSIIKKQSEEIKKTREILLKTDGSLTIYQSNYFEILQIILNEHQFQKCIKEKNFFFRQNCIQKTKFHHSQRIPEEEMSLFVNGKQISKKDLQQNSTQQLKQNWNLKIPKQFLVKDQSDNYYVYKECLEINNKIFKPFQITSPIEQYISSFFKYFYLATSKNLALTECEYGESKDNSEIIISSIIIHSKYEKGFSCFDKGRVEEFEEMLNVHDKTNQRYWSDELEQLAKKVWNDPYIINMNMIQILSSIHRFIF
ncbi:unnamed protein product [Paramecium octaurelia]|uniref:Uncharacterized protein n=1 Tax=Paramecium octaurelia TaxID=43137 RepID=A0A8S1V754_PAROT|nr:unnamed protein product [Paramecium octaurelia]